MSINDDAMADLARLPDPDYIHVSKLDDPIGSDRSWKFPAMRKMLHRAESAERTRDELLEALEHLLSGSLSLPRFAEEQARKDNMVMTAVSRAVVIGVTIAVASVIYNKYFK